VRSQLQAVYGACMFVALVVGGGAVLLLAPSRSVLDAGNGPGRTLPIPSDTALANSSLLTDRQRSTRVQSSAPEPTGMPDPRVDPEAGANDSLARLTGLGGSPDGWSTIGASADPAYQPSRERWMDRGASIIRALDASREDVKALPEPFWKENESFRWILSKPWSTLGEVLPQNVEVELARQWDEPDTQALWKAHQALYRAQANLLMLQEAGQGSSHQAELDLVRARLKAVREALWSENAELLFLWHAEEALRDEER
jgi:hypothetical protein